LRTYRAPRDVMRRRTGGQVREDLALAILMGACVLIFVAQWPRLAREAHLDATIGFDARLAGALFGWLFVAPLFFYVLALVIHAVLRLTGSAATGYEVRMSLFWGLLAAAPLFLLTGLAAGFAGSGTVPKLIGAVAFGALLVFWVTGVSDVARRRSETKV
jgi:hypothetical protein